MSPVSCLGWRGAKVCPPLVVLAHRLLGSIIWESTLYLLLSHRLCPKWLLLKLVCPCGEKMPDIGGKGLQHQ
jgi:hypothetical protein